MLLNVLLFLYEKYAINLATDWNFKMSNKKVSETETEWLFKDLLEDKGYLTDGDLIVEFKDKTYIVN